MSTIKHNLYNVYFRQIKVYLKYNKIKFKKYTT